MVSYDKAFKESLEYFDGDDLAAKVFLDKYALRDQEQNLLETTPRDMHHRIAGEIHRVEQKKFKNPMSYEQIFGYLDRFKKLVPQGSPMYGIGNPYQYVTLSNCYITETPDDSFGSIHKTDEQLSQISKRRGGCGIDISRIRPSGSVTQNAARTSTGIIPFMERFSNSIREVGQGGRRGALMITISVHHPEVLDFAKVKKDLSKVTGANISIRLTDEFLNAVKADADYEQRWPVEGKPKFSRMVSAKKVWAEIIDCAWSCAEPGLLFWDNIIRESPADCYEQFETRSTNPCSELPLSELDSCRLFLINLYNYVKNPFTNNAYFDYKEFYEDCKILQRFMDDVIDLELESIDRIIGKVKSDPESESVKRAELEMWEKVRSACANGRRTGSGITALGDTLAAMGVRYGSNESVMVTEKIYRTLKLGCYRSSVDMAKELGAFPAWSHEKEKDNAFLLRIREEDSELYEDMKKYGRRNIAILTTAPAGSVSILTRTTSGIEPVFMLSYTRRKKINPNDQNAKVDFVDQTGDSWQEFVVHHPGVKVWMDITGEKDVRKSPYHGCCAEDIEWIKRVELQAAAHKHVDHSISSTINLPEDVTREKVAEIYETAWAMKCKGITVYRKNCRDGVLVEKKRGNRLQKTTAPVRPKQLPCSVCFSKGMFVAVGLLDGEPYEVFAGSGVDVPSGDGKITKLKRGSYNIEVDGVVAENIGDRCSDNEEALTRMVSTSLRHGADIQFVVHQLEKVKGSMNTLAKFMARCLKKYIKDGAVVWGECCGECSSDSLIRQEGCVTCKSCGWSKCS